jgi:hypothetical protein
MDKSISLRQASGKKSEMLKARDLLGLLIKSGPPFPDDQTGNQANSKGGRLGKGI